MEGKDADHRTDIFAFGAVVYEMATGQRAFSGESQASLIAAILEREPVAMSTLQTMTPARLDEIVTTCLAKDPDDRWQSAGDLGRETKGIIERGAHTGASAPDATPEPTKWRPSVGAAVAASMIVAVITGLAVWGITWQRPSAPPPPERFVIATSSDGPLIRNIEQPRVAISPDGTRIVYVGTRSGFLTSQLFLRQIGQLDSTPIQGTEGGRAPFFSPDGEWVGFSADSTLQKVPVLGGLPSTITDYAGRLAGASWGGDDDTVVFATTRNSGLMVVPADGGVEPAVLTRVGPGQHETHRWPEVLPDGKGVLFTAWSGSEQDSRIAALSVETGAINYLTTGGTNPHYSRTGHIVYARRGKLWAAGFDTKGLVLTTNPVPVVDGVTAEYAGAANEGGASSFGISPTGSLVYTPATLTSELVWVNKLGVEEPLTEIVLGFRKRVSLSPNGAYIALEVPAATGGDDVWIYDIETGTQDPVTTDSAQDEVPLWTLDGRHVVFASDRDGAWGLFRKQVDGTGPVERLVLREEVTSLTPISWSPDGTLLLFDELRRTWAAVVLSGDGDRPIERLVQSDATNYTAAISPNGTLVAYADHSTGGAEVYVAPFPGPGSPVRVSTSGGGYPKWSADGRELYYRNGPRRRQVWVVPVLETQPTFKHGSPTLLFEGDYSTYGGGGGWDLDPTTDRFLMVKQDPETELILVQNWSHELQRLVPTP